MSWQKAAHWLLLGYCSIWLVSVPSKLHTTVPIMGRRREGSMARGYGYRSFESSDKPQSPNPGSSPKDLYKAATKIGKYKSCRTPGPFCPCSGDSGPRRFGRSHEDMFFGAGPGHDGATCLQHVRLVPGSITISAPDHREGGGVRLGDRGQVAPLAAAPAIPMNSHQEAPLGWLQTVPQACPQQLGSQAGRALKAGGKTKTRP